MNQASTEHLASFDQTALTPLVRQVLGNDSAEILDWEHQALLGGR
jgi:hypothetical protein